MADQIQILDISMRLREIMLANKLSVAQIAELAGVSKSTMEKYLSGPSSPRATAIVNICAALNINSDWLLLGKVETEKAMIGRAITLAALFEIQGLLRKIQDDPEFRETAFSSSNDQGGINNTAYKYARLISQKYHEYSDFEVGYGQPIEIQLDDAIRGRKP